MEFYWKIAAVTEIVLEMFLMGYFLYRFTKPFLKQKKYAWGIGVIYPVTMLTLYFMPAQISNFAAYSIGIWLAFVVMCMIDRRNYKQKIFITVTFYAIRWLSVYLAQTLCDVLYQNIVYTTYMRGHENMQLALFVAVNLLGVVCIAVIVGLSCYFMVNAYVYKDEEMTVKELFMLSTPSVTGMTGYAIMQYYQTYYESHAGNRAENMYSILAIAHYTIFLILIVVVIILFQSIKAGQEEKLQSELLETQIEDTRRHIEQVENLYHDIRSLKHDMANHVMTLEQLYEKNEIRQAKEYTDSLKNALYDATKQVKSGNPVTDVILVEYQEKAHKKGIIFESSFFYPENEKLDALDVSVILNNALENAVEAAGAYKKNHEQSHVRICSYRKSNAYMIEVVNSFEGVVEMNSDTGLPVTQKQTKGHGYGLSNIRQAAEKYYGGIDIRYENDRFRLVVMLMLA